MKRPLVYSLDQRIERARALRKEGYNCSQCVAMVFDDVYDLDPVAVASLSASFGSGVGGMRQVCGTVSGLSMVLGATGYSGPADKASLYAAVKECGSEFEDMNGSIVCGELLKPGRKPCIELIEDAIRILHRRLS